MDEYGDYYLGLDIGTSSVGWAVTDEQYNVLEYRRKAMWGIHLFDEGETASERRMHRCARRRLVRRKQRLTLLRELFSPEISKVDMGFYARLDEGGFHMEDRAVAQPNSLFNDEGFTDKEFHERHPTIYHLRKDLTHTDVKPGIRLVYLAVAHIIKHRGHFLFETPSEGDMPRFDNSIPGLGHGPSKKSTPDSFFAGESFAEAEWNPDEPDIFDEFDDDFFERLDKRRNKPPVGEGAGGATGAGTETNQTATNRTETNQTETNQTATNRTATDEHQPDTHDSKKGRLLSFDDTQRMQKEIREKGRKKRAQIRAEREARAKAQPSDTSANEPPPVETPPVETPPQAPAENPFDTYKASGKLAHFYAVMRDKPENKMLRDAVRATIGDDDMKKLDAALEKLAATAEVYKNKNGEDVVGVSLKGRAAKQFMQDPVFGRVFNTYNSNWRKFAELRRGNNPDAYSAEFNRLYRISDPPPGSTMPTPEQIEEMNRNISNLQSLCKTLNEVLKTAQKENRELREEKSGWCRRNYGAVNTVSGAGNMSISHDTGYLLVPENGGSYSCDGFLYDYLGYPTTVSGDTERAMNDLLRIFSMDFKAAGGSYVLGDVTGRDMADGLAVSNAMDYRQTHTKKEIEEHLSELRGIMNAMLDGGNGETDGRGRPRPRKDLVYGPVSRGTRMSLYNLLDAYTYFLEHGPLIRLGA